MLKKQFLCICCPTGCRLSAEREVTATAASDSAAMPRIPVRTDRGLPRRYIDALLNRLYHLKVAPPVKCGTILIENVENTGVNVIFSCDCDR